MSLITSKPWLDPILPDALVTIGRLHDRSREPIPASRAFDTRVCYNEKLQQQGIRPESVPAIIAPITQGSLPRNEIKTFTGLSPRLAIDELSRLIKVGLVESRTPKSRIVTPGLPAWFAQDIFPDLHRRF